MHRTRRHPGSGELAKHRPSGEPNGGAYARPTRSFRPAPAKRSFSTLSVSVSNTTLSPRPSSCRRLPLPARSGWRRTAKCDRHAPGRGLLTRPPGVSEVAGPIGVTLALGPNVREGTVGTVAFDRGESQTEVEPKKPTYVHLCGTGFVHAVAGNLGEIGHGLRNTRTEHFSRRRLHL